MRSVLIDKDPMKIAVARMVLEREGILCFVRNEHLSNLTGGSLGPFVYRLRLFDPELCVVSDEDWNEACRLLNDFKTTALSAEWTCSQCHELVPTSFDICWNCSSEPASPAQQTNS